MKKIIILLINLLYVLACSNNEPNGYFTVLIHNPNSNDLLFTSQIIRHNYYANEDDCYKGLTPFDETENKKTIKPDQTVSENFTVLTGYEDDEIRIEYAIKDLSDDAGYTGKVYRTEIYMKIDQKKIIDLFGEGFSPQ